MSSPTIQKDVYKEFHRLAYHPSVTRVFANFTNRSNTHSNIEDCDGVYHVGLQYFIQDYLIEDWNEHFFNVPVDDAVANHHRYLSAMLGFPVDVQYLRDLHALGHLPLLIKSLPEGMKVPYQVPSFTVVNTHPDFAWLTNAIETVLSCEVWPMQTSLTTSVAYLKNFKESFERTGVPMELLPFMGHDFSFRGMFGRHAAAMSGFAHLASGFAGTDTIPALEFAERFYDADVDAELVGCSVCATEHSVTCSWIEEGEIAFIRYLMNEACPTGILSIVADTWDFWKLVNEYLPLLHDEIMARDGKVVIRPDSGDPVKIVCGDPGALEGSPEFKGLVECLWDEFGGTTTAQGFRILDEHVGAIYGDAITLERQEQIIAQLEAKGFAPTVVLGIGSYTYQFVTRDTHGSAVKATHVIKEGKGLSIYKKPATDVSKKSARGLLRVDREDGELKLFDMQSEEGESMGLLQPVFKDGKALNRTTLGAIRERVWDSL